MIATMFTDLSAVEVPATSEETKEAQAEINKLIKARDQFASMGIDTNAADEKIASLTAELENKEGGKDEVVASLTDLNRLVSTQLRRWKGERVESLSEKYSALIENGTPDFPGAVEQRKIANGTMRAVHGARERQIVEAFLNLSKCGIERVDLTEFAEALCAVDSSLGDADSAEQQIRNTLTSFADVWTKDKALVLVVR